MRNTYFLRVIESLIHFIDDSSEIITLYNGCKQKQFKNQQCFRVHMNVVPRSTMNTNGEIED